MVSCVQDKNIATKVSCSIYSGRVGGKILYGTALKIFQVQVRSCMTYSNFYYNGSVRYWLADLDPVQRITKKLFIHDFLVESKPRNLDGRE